MEHLPGAYTLHPAVQSEHKIVTCVILQEIKLHKEGASGHYIVAIAAEMNINKCTKVAIKGGAYI